MEKKLNKLKKGNYIILEEVEDEDLIGSKFLVLENLKTVIKGKRVYSGYIHQYKIKKSSIKKFKRANKKELKKPFLDGGLIPVE